MPDSTHVEDASAAIRATHRAWVEAVARGDIAALRDLLVEDYESWPAGSPPLVGREPALAALGQALAVMEVRQVFDSRRLVVGDDWATDCGIESFVLTPRDGGDRREHRQRAVILLRRCADGRWRYAWGMTSPEATAETEEEKK